MKPSLRAAPEPVAPAGVDIAVGLEVPDKIGAADLDGLFTNLSAAVPSTVGRDAAEQRKERLVIQVIYRMVEAVKDHAPENAWDRESAYDKELERVINARLKAAGGKGKARVQKNSPLETRIARCIFPDRRRAHIASKVIRAAMVKGKGSGDLLAFIEESHGTEAIRRQTSGTSTDDALDLMWKTKPLTTITTLPRELVGEHTSAMPRSMLFTVRRTGEVDVRWIGDSTPTARSALAALAKARAKSVVSPDASAQRAKAT